jgi:two-component system chemotaxis response regulator CheY
LLKGSPPCLILTNMMMPVCDGWTFLRELRKMPQATSVPVIIMSSLGVASPDWARSLGAVDFIRLPADSTELLAVIRSHLGA